MGASKSLEDLRKMSDKYLIKEHDELAKSTQVGINYYLDELERRERNKQNKIIVRCTIIITIFTIVNAIFVIMLSLN